MARPSLGPNVTRACTGADTPVNQQSQEAAEAAVLCLTNMERSQHGLPALTPHYALTSPARWHADAAVASPWWRNVKGVDFPTHPPPRHEYLRTMDSRITIADYCRAPTPRWIAENTYTATPNPTPRHAVRWWRTFVQDFGSCLH